jgi:hypothetical protein
MARPPKWTSIPAEKVQQLAEIGCTNIEIGDFFGVSGETIGRRFADVLTKGRAATKARLRTLQLKAANAGNVTMLIFLGKNMLGQADTLVFSDTAAKPPTVIGFDLPAPQVASVARATPPETGS